MLYYALMFLLLGVVAAALGLSGIAAVATQISWILFVVGVVLLIIHLVMGRYVSSDLAVSEKRFRHSRTSRSLHVWDKNPSAG